jgi:hypothetical protein
MELRAKLTSDYIEQSWKLKWQPDGVGHTSVHELYAKLTDAYIKKSNLLEELRNSMADTLAQKFICEWHEEKCNDFSVL